MAPLSQSFILGLIDALYHLTVTFSTVAYGDIIPQLSSAKIFASVLMLLRFGVLSYTVLDLFLQSISDRISARLLSCMDQGRVTSFLCYIDEDGMRKLLTKCFVALTASSLCIVVWALASRSLEEDMD